MAGFSQAPVLILAAEDIFDGYTRIGVRRLRSERSSQCVGPLRRRQKE
jgi:hypothetical protein